MNVSKLMVSFEGPAKPEVMLTTQRDGTVDCTYKTRVEGEYTINIQFDDEHVDGSPCKPVVTGEPDVDTSKVKVTGTLKEGRNLQLNTVIVDPTEAKITSKYIETGVKWDSLFLTELTSDLLPNLPKGQLQVYMEGTSKPDVSYRNNENGTSTVTYKAYTIGQYKLHLKYMDKHVPGSPFVIHIKWREFDLENGILYQIEHKQSWFQFQNETKTQVISYTTQNRELSVNWKIGIGVIRQRKWKINFENILLKNAQLEGTCNLFHFEYKFNLTALPLMQSANHFFKQTHLLPFQSFSGQFRVHN